MPDGKEESSLHLFTPLVFSIIIKPLTLSREVGWLNINTPPGHFPTVTRAPSPANAQESTGRERTARQSLLRWHRMVLPARLPDHSLEQTLQHGTGYNQCARKVPASDRTFRCLTAVSNVIHIPVTPVFKGGGPHSDQAQLRVLQTTGQF